MSVRRRRICARATLSTFALQLMSRTHWTTADFPSLSWHDNHVHGLSIREGPHGAGELGLDLDFILEWLPAEGAFAFRLAPATLTFHDVTDLSISIAYGRVGAAIGPFSIADVSREAHEYATGHSTFNWRILVNWPEGLISFRASGFTQTLRAEPCFSKDQCLTSALRHPVSGA